MKVNNNGEIIYPAAACAVIYNPQKNTQRIFRYHHDDVKCIALHPGGDIVATGEANSNDGIIHIWNSSDLKVLASISTTSWFGSYGVTALTFSSDGSRIAAVGGSPSNSQIVVISWENGEVLATKECSRNSVYYIESSPNDNSFILLAKNEVKFYSTFGETLLEKVADFNQFGSNQSHSDVIFNPLSGNAYISTNNGDILVLNGTKVVGRKQVSDSALYCISGNQEGFLTGGKDGIVRSWIYDSRKGIEFTQSGEINVGYPISSCVFGKDKRIYVWGKTNNRFEAFDQSGKREVIALNHTAESSQSSLYGLATVPSSSLFFTGGDDGRITLWDKKTKKSVGSVLTDKKIRGLAVSPDGYLLISSSSAGDIFVFKVSDFQNSIDSKANPIFSTKIGSQEIKILRFSPSGDKLAVGHGNGHIRILDVQNGLSNYQSLEGLSSPITGLDWSSDQKYIQASSGKGDYQLLFWEVDSGSIVEVPTQLRETKWETQTCLLGWCVRGIWDLKEYSNGEDINAVATLFSKSLLATVDINGDVNLLRYPTVVNNANRHKFIGHSSNATNLAFSDDGEHLYTIGGNDLTIFQWRVVRSAGPSDDAEKTREERRATLVEQIQSSANAEEPKIKPQVGRTSVLYRTSYQVYGSKPVDQASRHTTWRGINGKFSKQFVGGMFRNNGLNTSTSRHRVLKSTGFSDYDNL